MYFVVLFAGLDLVFAYLGVTWVGLVLSDCWLVFELLCVIDLWVLVKCLVVGLI